MEQKLRWAAYQPLIGGMAIGAERAFGSQPICILSYEGVANDDLYASYMNETRKLSVPHLKLKDTLYSLTEDGPWDSSELKDLDIVIGVPICAGLSSANTQSAKNSGSKMSMGSDAFQNNNMIGMLSNTLKFIKPRVYIFENAVKLATPLGTGIREKLVRIANENGYSTTIVKVNTINHGLPQSRTRTFFIAWKSDKAYKLKFEPVDCPSIMDIIGDLKDQKPIFPEVLYFSNWMSYLEDKYGKEWREGMAKDGETSADMVVLKYNDFDYAKKFFPEKGQMILERWKSKRAQGLGWMSFSPVWRGPDLVSTLYKRSLYRLVHPVEDRVYSVREVMRLMGLPDDMTEPAGNFFMLGQNVPVCTAQYYCAQVVKGLSGELEKASEKNIVQDFLSKSKKFKFGEY